MGGGLCVLLGVSDRETDASVVGLPLDMGGDCDGALYRRDGAAVDVIICCRYVVCIVRIVLIAVTVIGERGNLGQGTERKQIHPTTIRSGG